MFGKLKKMEKGECRKFSERTKLRLPEDYRKFLMESNGMVFYDGNIGFCLKGERNSIYMNELLGIGSKESKSGADIIGVFTCHEEEIPANMIIIGETIETGKILLDCGEEESGIYLWDCDRVLCQSREGNCIYKVANSFEEFMGKLHRVA